MIKWGMVGNSHDASLAVFEKGSFGDLKCVWASLAKDFSDVINFSRQLNKLVVITRGEKGAVAVNGEEIFESDVKKNLKIVDLTGAGDLFAAGYLHGYINKYSIKDCLEQGTDLSSKIIQKIGARI